MVYPGLQVLERIILQGTSPSTCDTGQAMRGEVVVAESNLQIDTNVTLLNHKKFSHTKHSKQFGLICPE
jgi:hypothetical protein